MIYTQFQDKKLSLLGFGAMRLPTLEDGSIDEKQTEAMTRYAIEHGVNYFDTAYPYHAGQSERVLGRALAQFPRDAFLLADKFPGHQIASAYDPAKVFEHQLSKCGVDYFDFYLLHNVYENSVKTYADPRWGIVDYFIEQKKRGRIRHLGFSSHAGLQTLRAFLQRHGDNMEFCQIQLNYLDWTLQNGKERMALLREFGMPVWVMEPVRGGKLASLTGEAEALLRQMRPDDSPAAWAFRFLQGLEGVGVILSGMSNMAQMEDNIRTFSVRDPLTEDERDILLTIADGMAVDAVPCTACRYCTEGCPMGLDIPELLKIYNELRVAPSMNTSMRIEALPAEKRPGACVACGKCAKVCPQGIDIPSALADCGERVAKMPSWAEICRQRDAQQS